MYNQVCAGAPHMVSIAGLPAQFLANASPAEDKVPPKKKQRNQQSDDTTSGDSEAKAAPWNAKLEKALADPAKRANYPKLFKIMQYCGIAKGDPIMPGVGPDDCRHYLLWGRCQHGKKCRWKHRTATDAQADAAILKLEKFIKNPEELKGASS